MCLKIIIIVRYLRARTPPPFLSPLPEIVRVLGAIIALVLAVGVAVTIMVGSFGWVTALNCPFPVSTWMRLEKLSDFLKNEMTILNTRGLRVNRLVSRKLVR